jgi:hypothetical protein
MEKGMNQLVPTGDRTGRCLNPNRVSIWPVETGGYGIDFTYHGATGYTDAEFAEQILQAGGLETSFRQELDGAWTVRFGPLPRDHMRAVLDRFAW